MAAPPLDAAPRPPPRLALITPPVADAEAFGTLLPPVLAAGDVAAVLLRLAPAETPALLGRIGALAPIVQGQGVALVVESAVDLVRASGADGVHVAGIAAVKQALAALHPGRIVGAGGLVSRHEAMLAGEAGADYLLFGEPDAAGRRPTPAAVIERVAWWAEIFEVPCIGYAGELAEVAPLARAGADFVALGEWLWRSEAAAAAAVAAAMAQLAEGEEVA